MRQKVSKEKGSRTEKQTEKNIRKITVFSKKKSFVCVTKVTVKMLVYFTFLQYLRTKELGYRNLVKYTLMSYFFKTVTGGISDNFQMRKSGKISNYGRIISENCRQIWKLFL
jgi:hypothetical protein